MNGYIFVNRKSKPHIRKKAKDAEAGAAVHPNKVVSRLQFAEASYNNYGKPYSDFIKSVKHELSGKAIRHDELPIISREERTNLMAAAAKRGIDPRIVDEIAYVLPQTPHDVLAATHKAVDRNAYLAVLQPSLFRVQSSRRQNGRVVHDPLAER